MAFSSKAIALFILEVLLLISINCYADENCETLPTEIHVTKDNINGYYGKLLGNALMHTTCTHTEEYDEMGSLMRSCSGEVSVNKCEGICNSQVQPSVVTPTGFLKECYCCKENYLRERLVTLTHCYDADGMRFQDEDRAIMEVRLREPAECKCYKCGDYSR